MKKATSILLVIALMLALAACGNSNNGATNTGNSSSSSANAGGNESGNSNDSTTQDNGVDESKTGKLVIYTTAYDLEYNLLIEEGFRKKYPNIQIETVQAGAGELKTRIESEMSNPIADVMYGGLVYSDWDLGLWEEYVTPNNDQLPDGMKNTTGYLTFHTLQLENFIINNEAAEKAGINPEEITSFKSLLDPRLKGKIIWADPTASSAAWNFLANMLNVMGGFESEEAWNYVDQLLANGLVLSNSSSTVYKSVYDGEYVVGLTYEAPVVSYIEGGEGDKIRLVFMEEGTGSFAFASAIVKGAKNMENAKLLMDFFTSDEAQKLWASSTARHANSNIPTTNPYLTDINEINVVPIDYQYLKDHKNEIIEKFQSLYVKHN